MEFPTISRVLTERLVVSVTAHLLYHLRSITPAILYITELLEILHETIVTQISEITPCGKIWIPEKHITNIAHNL